MEHLPHLAEGKPAQGDQIVGVEGAAGFLAQAVRPVERLILRAAQYHIQRIQLPGLGPWRFLAVHFLQANDIGVQPTQLRLERGNTGLNRRVLGADVDILDIERGDAQAHERRLASRAPVSKGDGIVV